MDSDTLRGINDSEATSTTGSTQNAPHTEELDFSQEPIFADTRQSTKVDIPGLPGSYIVIKAGIDWKTDQGRNNFARNTQKFATEAGGKRVPLNEMDVTYDIVGLQMYKLENCLEDWCIQQGDKTERMQGRPQRTKNFFLNVCKSAKLTNWIVQQIDKAMGWDEEAQEKEKSFPQ